jgi:GT2 family glycosyltransferase
MKVGALIVTYNRLAKLKETLKATMALPFENIIVVNNASTDDTAEWLQTLTDHRLTILTISENCGGAGGFKYGSRWISLNLAIDWVLFYDDDAYPRYDFFDRLSEESLEPTVVYACNVKNKKDQRCKMNIPWKKYPHGIFGNIKYKLNDSLYVPDGELKEHVVSVSFVGMLINISVLKLNYRFIDESLFIYYDDVFFAHNLIQNKIPIIYLPNVNVIHDVDTTDVSIAPWKLYYLVRNLILSRHLFIQNPPFSVVDIMLRLAKYCIVALMHSQCKNALSSVIAGVVDGLKNCRGKRHTS